MYLLKVISRFETVFRFVSTKHLIAIICMIGQLGVLYAEEKSYESRTLKVATVTDTMFFKTMDSLLREKRISSKDYIELAFWNGNDTILSYYSENDISMTDSMIIAINNYVAPTRENDYIVRYGRRKYLIDPRVVSLFCKQTQKTNKIEYTRSDLSKNIARIWDFILIKYKPDGSIQEYDEGSDLYYKLSE